MNQAQENQDEVRQEQKAGELLTAEKPAEPLEHGPPVDPEPEPKPAKEQARICTICGGPDHRGCGCEAKQKRIEQDNNPGLANLEKELERDEALEKTFDLPDPTKEAVSVKVPPEVTEKAIEVLSSLGKFPPSLFDKLDDITTALNMIVSQNDVIIEHQRNKAKIISELVKNGSAN